MSPRRDAGAGARLADLFPRLDAWAAGLPASDAPAARRLLARRDAAAVERDPRRLALLEEGLVTDLLATNAVVATPLEVGRASLAAAVRSSLARLSAAHPGRLVEVRVPPFGAVQVGVGGVASVHARGTPPNVVEADAATWLALASGQVAWADAVADHRVRASGVHADLGALLPLA